MMNMNKMIFGATLLALAGAASANDAYPFPKESAFTSTKTRAEVTAEVTQARAQHTLPTSVEANYPPQIEVVTQRSREAVKTEAIQANHRHGFNPDYTG
jgi:hypothetical protein